MLNHTEAVFQVRKYLIDQAIKIFPHYLTENATRELLLMIYQKQK